MKVIHVDEREAWELLEALRSASAVVDAVGLLKNEEYPQPWPGKEPAGVKITRGIRFLEETLGNKDIAE
jgi:hypothetical protein